MDCVAPLTSLRRAWRHFTDVCPPQKGKHVHTDEWTCYFCFRARRIFLYVPACVRSLCCALVKITSHYHLDSVEMQAASCFPPWMLLLLMCNVHLLVSDSAASVLQTIRFSIRRRWKRTDVLYRWGGGGYILKCCYLFIYSRSNKLLLWVDTVVLTEKCCVNAILRHSPLRSFFCEHWSYKWKHHVRRAAAVPGLKWAPHLILFSKSVCVYVADKHHHD